MDQTAQHRAGEQATGLAGIVIAHSSLCYIDGQKGELRYRGYDIHELARQATFEETAALLWDGDLPGQDQLLQLKQELSAARALPDAVVNTFQSFPDSVGPMASLRTGVSMLAAFDGESQSGKRAEMHRAAIGLAARIPSLVACQNRLTRGLKIIPPDSSASTAGNFLWMLTGQAPSSTAERALDTALVLHAEHGFNASTFSARVTASTRSDIHSAVVAAIATLKGPLHGGANRAVMATLEEIGDVRHIETAVKERLARRKRIMGFGHRVYKTMDPRAVHLKEMARVLGEEQGDSRWYEMSARMEEIVFQEKGLYPNVDFYSAAAYRSLGIPAATYPAVFACSRIAGWTAHVMEQDADNRLIRPRAEYIGPPPRRFVPLAERG